MKLPALQKLIAVAKDPSTKSETLQQSAHNFFQELEKLNKADAAAAMAELAKNYDLADPERGDFLALLCGAMVERGHDPLPMARPLRIRLQTRFEQAADLADACRDELPEVSQPKITREARDEFGDDEEQGVAESDEFTAVRLRLKKKMPKENAAWEALQTFWRPAIAVFSVSPEARYAAQGLRELAKRIADQHEGGHWVQLILSVLDHEPLLVLEPSTGLGILARSYGIVDNFQLHTLLMDAFPKSDSRGGARVSLADVEIARGTGPQSGDGAVTGAWNFFTYKGLLPSGQLPPPNDPKASEHWIWGEGIPGDIPLFDGRRVILLGPPTYERSWGSQRMFDHLRANLHIEQRLSPAEVKEWLQRLADARR